MRDSHILRGDALTRLRELPAESVQCVVTSPPYWGLRDYGVEGQLGLERTPEEYVAKMVEVFREVRRVLRKDGTLWLNIGDSYAGSGKGQNGDGTHAAKCGEKQKTSAGTTTGGLPVGYDGLKPKDLVGIPWMLAFALRADGWWLRQDIIWSKKNPMPESVTDRCTKAHEYVFLLTRAATYYYDAEAVKEAAVGGEPGNVTHKGKTAYENGDERMRTKVGLTEMGAASSRNKRSVWEIATEPYPEAHFATYPTKLVEPCILAGTSERGCCAECGKPWVRVVERRFQPQPDVRDEAKLAKASNKGMDESNGWGDTPRGTTETRTLGWKPACSHNGDPIPCAVLDPFAGAGTTGLVALRLGRNFIGIELNTEYAAMAERRIQTDAPLFNSEPARTPPAEQMKL